MLKTHKIALVTNNREATLLARHAGFARFAYNSALADFKEGLDRREWLGERTLRPRFNALKESVAPWSTDLSQNAGKYAIIDLGQAIDRWGEYRKAKKAWDAGGRAAGMPKPRHVGFPRFHRRATHCSFRADNGPGTIRVDGRAVRLPKIGWIRTREELRFAGVVAEATVTREAGHWYACIAVRTPEPPPTPIGGPVVGVDVGIRTLAVCSDGAVYSNPRALRLHSSRLRRVDKAIARSRKVHGEKKRSKRRERLYLRRQRLHVRTANIRNDAHHKATSAIAAKPVGTVRAETLNVSGMVKNRRLARALADAGLAGFLGKLEYKCGWKGIAFQKVDRWYPSTKTCSACGTVRPNMGLGERTFLCYACGVMLDRDLNAAVNLAAYAESSPVKGRGADVRPGRSGSGQAVATKRQNTANVDNHRLSEIGVGS